MLLPAPAAAQGNGSSVAPYATLFEWNRTNMSQFTKVDVPTPNNMVETLVSTQTSLAYSVTPMVQWTNGIWPGGPYRYVLTPDAYSATAEEDLVIEADLALISAPQDRHGIGCFDPQNPTSNFYLLTRDGSTFWAMQKYIGGTRYAQTAPAVGTGYGGAMVGPKTRVRFILTASGGVRVHLYGMSVIDVPMTLGNSTVLTSCKPGIVVNAYQGGGMSMFQVFRMKRDGEQLF